MKSFESGGVYGKLPETEPLIEKYKPSYFSRGGEHLVYKIPEHPHVVIKASAHKITNILSKYYEQGEPNPDAVKKAVEDEFSKEVAEKNIEARELREVFGRDHVLNEKRYLMQVPVTREIIEELYREDHFKREVPATIGNAQDVWTHVIVQSFTPEAANPERQSFSFGSLVESGSSDKELYDEVTRTTVSGTQHEGLEDKLLELQDSSTEKSLGTVPTRATSNQKHRFKPVFLITHARG